MKEKRVDKNVFANIYLKSEITETIEKNIKPIQSQQ